MGYYADLIKQKQEKKNFRDPLGLGLTFHELGTPDDYKAKFKKGDKVKLRYGSGFKGEGVIVEGPIKMRASLTPTYRIKLTDGKVVGRYEEELAKNSKDNSKEEKDNDSESRLMEIAEKVLREYPESTKSYAKFEDRFLTKAGWGYNPSKVKTIKEIWERVANSKEEKDNASIQDRFRYKGCMITILKKGENQYTFTIEQNGREEGTNKVYPSQDKAEREAKREVEVNWNEKEETENASEADIRAMYSQIQELKKKGIKGENIDKFYAAVNYRAAAEEHRKKYKQTGQEAYKIAAEKADRQADQWIKEINRSIRNEKEKGYYAKLAEEKQERKNYKFTDKEIADYLKSNPSSAKQYVRKKTAGKAENITIHPETLTAELEENGKIHVFKFVSDESLGFILKYIGTK